MIAIAENTQTGSIDLPLILTMEIITNVSVDDNPHYIPSNCIQAQENSKTLAKPGRNIRNKLWKKTEIEKWKRQNRQAAEKYIINDNIFEEEKQSVKC